MINNKINSLILKLQGREITEKEIYTRIAKYIKNQENRSTLLRIAEEEQRHYDIWKKYTKVDVKPSKPKVFYYIIAAKLLGYTYAIKQMEARQNKIKIDEAAFKELESEISEFVTIQEDELIHEQKLIGLLDEERLHYVGSMVLGLNDALVEFSGSLAGYTFALQSNKLISLAGLITGISATLSMASSEFLSTRADGEENAGKSALFTGVAYLITVVLLILPYLLLPNKLYGVSLLIMLVFVILIIAVFNYYISIAKDLSFKKRFSEMTIISLSVAAVSFLIGLAVKHFLGIEL